MEELIPQNRQEAMLRNIALATGGEAVTEELVPQWDDEKFLDDILKAAQGESPVYNIEPRWHHQKFYKAIADALAASGGGYELVGSKEFVVNTTSTSEIAVGSIPIDATKIQEDTIIVTICRDKAGKRNSHSFASLTASAYRGGSSVVSKYATNAGIAQSISSSYGVYAKSYTLSSGDGSIPIKAKYNSSYGTINGTFLCEVYIINPPVDVFSGDPIE